jgi:tetratricopeptide (TPR) repeat protein
MRHLAVLFLFLLPVLAGAAEDPEARGDRLWARRAEGFAASGRADPALAGGAVAAYEEALRAQPQDLRLRFKLIEALYFAGHFADRNPAAARARFDRAVALSDEACARVAAQAGGPALDPLQPVEARAKALAGVSGAVDAHFWAAVSWGLWGMSHGNMESALHGVADRIRDHASLVAALDPTYRDAAGWRLLGRLHTQVPRLPVVTEWVSRDQGISLLRRAVETSDRDARNPLYLAEALLSNRPKERSAALSLLREVTQRTPRPGSLIEDSEILAQARKTLGQAEKAKPAR